MAGASTPYPFTGITDRTMCICLPGYYGVRDKVSGYLLSCTPCGINFHRRANMNESLCVPCPTGMMTPTPTSINCYCNPGTYSLTPDDTAANCIFCEAGSYCEGGMLHVSCPPNSFSSPGASTRSDCKCNAGFYGNLADPSVQCQSLPLAMNCENKDCTCADGWEPVYHPSASTHGMNMTCIVKCNKGQYAQIDHVTFAKIACIPCPVNTYSSSDQTIEIPGLKQQCTPCPLNYETNGPGKTSALDCSCM